MIYILWVLHYTKVMTSERVEAMFDMIKVGRNIARLRGQAGITQMGLADKLGISYQAVSNWERGNSMPDIAKLPELAEIFGVSIEEILDEGKATRIISSLLENKTGEYLQQHEVSAEDISGIAPLLHMEQVGEVFEQVKDKVSLSELVPLAPFLSEEVLDECARKAMEGGSLSDLVPLAPYLSEEVLDECALQAMHEGRLSDLVPLAPFLSEEALNKCARKVISSGKLGDLTPLLPYLESDTVDKIALRMMAE
ncbi:helix-turn-helix domain-containing protein [Paenibacillus typhae]|uniref:helix-turn-helix domain-containing protein n=1 Tax=Paenibacillus typhae TaxID=1174501 RepID=UPI001C8E28E7|nr:helix-turn-helix transcriptional regulator [Paenibacillus typhae]